MTYTVTEEGLATIEPGLEFTFQPIYDQMKKRWNQQAIVICPVPEEQYDAEECGPLFYVHFEDNTTDEAWPEEILE